MADLAAAKQHYSEGKAYLEQEDYVLAYGAFDAALERVSDYEDAKALRKQAIARARYKLGLFVFRPTIVERDVLSETDKPKSSKWQQLKRWIEEPDDDLLKKADERHRLEETAHIEIVRGLDARPAHIQLVPNHEVNGIVKEHGFNPDAVTEEEVIQAARKSDILIAGLSEAYLDFDQSKEKKEANTGKKVKYTDEKRKKRKRDEFKKGYRYYVYEKKVRTKCMLPYQIIDTRTGAVMKDGVLSAEDGDRVKFVNWNNYDDVRPDQLRVKDGEKFKRLASSDRKLFDARMKLKGKWDMLFKASEQMGSELSHKLREILETYNPGRSFGSAQD